MPLEVPPWAQMGRPPAGLRRGGGDIEHRNVTGHLLGNGPQPKMRVRGREVNFPCGKFSEHKRGAKVPDEQNYGMMCGLIGGETWETSLSMEANCPV